MTKQLYLSNLGIVNALGDNAADIVKNFVTPSKQGMVKRSDLLIDEDVYVGTITTELPNIENLPLTFHSRNNRVLLKSYYQIADQINALIKKYGNDRIAVVLGTSTSGISETEHALRYKETMHAFPKQYHYNQQEMGSPALFLATFLGLRNAAITVSTACASSGKAFITARNLITSGFCDAALVGGVDTLCRLTLNGFNALESISKQICNPFSQNRDGITIGEGAALFILSPDPSSIELVGLGESCDAYHMSAPDPKGIGAQSAIENALNEAQITPKQISYINLHGTATIKNDEMEAAVVNRLFGTQLPCSSTKALTGHTLGAASAIELGLCCLALSAFNETQAMPPHVWDEEKDEKIPFINLISPHNSDCVFNNTQQDHYIMSNSFAFGGSNVSIIIKKNANHASTNN